GWRVLEKVPWGVRVEGAGGVEVMNPEARRLLRVPTDCAANGDGRLPAEFAKVIAKASGERFFCEQEIALAGNSGDRFIGVSRADISDQSGAPADTIWIVRDITEQKRIAREREGARRSLALAEVATVLAHEIRNPLGSMELFTGLLADATAHLPETRQWVTHLQAGLRSLSATVNNVLQLHAQGTPQMLPTELDRLVSETADFLRPL